MNESLNPLLAVAGLNGAKEIRPESDIQAKRRQMDDNIVNRIRTQLIALNSNPSLWDLKKPFTVVNVDKV